MPMVVMIDGVCGQLIVGRRNGVRMVVSRHELVREGLARTPESRECPAEDQERGAKSGTTIGGAPREAAAIARE